VRSYEHIIEDEVMREIATWPEGREFKTLQPMLRMTLNVILRAVFGAEGPALDELRGLLPPLVAMVGAIAGQAPLLRRDLGPWSPGAAASAVPAPVRHCRRLAHRRRAGRPGPRRPQRRARAAGAGPLRQR
jgi:hypothetical protein